MKVSIYVRNATEGPSCYYRIMQYFSNISVNKKVHNIMSQKMFRINLDCKFNYAKIIIQGCLFLLMCIRAIWFLATDLVYKPDIVVVSRTILPRHTLKFVAFLEKKLFKQTKLVWDFDDYIFLNREISTTEAELFGRYSQKNIVTNSFLAGTLDKKYQNKICILPTTDGDFENIDLRKEIKDREKSYESEIRFVWLGTGGNIIFVEQVLNELDMLAKKIKVCLKKEVILYVISNKELRKKTNYIQIKNVNWSRERAIQYVAKSHVGIMPLPHTEYTNGKGGFKLIQYMAAGIPVIGSNVGMNREIVNDEFGFLLEDKDNLECWENVNLSLFRDFNIWKKYCEKSRDEWSKRFSFQAGLDCWKKIIKELK
ncbi:glycosyltransferase [Sellimonas catena]|uniref:Glycosyltransferase n=1 Tax=Sellimonas catena TaxID=2994035 RepID=A0A9W6C901_9FIRM|nr:glycosyltransferase [Sellimonas catena]GLG06123.1 hypothetical protein Selli1_32970 [Sellimonas catena]